MSKIILTAILLSGLIGCAPRGETKTLEQILEIAKGRFDAAVSVNGGGNAQSVVSSTAKSLDHALQVAEKGDSTLSGALSEIGSNLSSLTSVAGYTSRPALNELSLQYRNLGASGKISADQVKLLAARTYTLLASELETSAFRYSTSG